MNRSILVGRLTKDPELKKTSSGSSVLNFTIAINRTYTNANGDKEADFINCVAWGRTADNMASYVAKGSLIGVEGRIQTRSYEDANSRRVYVTEVYADSVQFLESKKQDNKAPSVKDLTQDFGFDISDEDFPF